MICAETLLISSGFCCFELWIKPSRHLIVTTEPGRTLAPTASPLASLSSSASVLSLPGWWRHTQHQLLSGWRKLVRVQLTDANKHWSVWERPARSDTHQLTAPVWHTLGSEQPRCSSWCKTLIWLWCFDFFFLSFFLHYFKVLTLTPKRKINFINPDYSNLFF